MGTVAPATNHPQKGPRKRWLKGAWQLGCLLLASLVIACSLTFWHLENRGLPEWIKRELVRRLAEKGLDLSFASMRWLPGEGLIVEDTRLQIPGNQQIGSFTAKAIVLQTNPMDWLLGNFQIEKALLREGRLESPLSMSEAPPWLIDGISTRLALHSRDWWELEFLKADTMGVQWHISGSLTNAVQLKDLAPAKPKTESVDQAPKQLLDQLIRLSQQVQFEGQPTVRLHLDLDAGRPSQSTAHASLASGPIRIGQQVCEGLELECLLKDQANSDASEASWQLTAIKTQIGNKVMMDVDLQGKALLDLNHYQPLGGQWQATLTPSKPGNLSGGPVEWSGSLQVPEEEGAQWSVTGNLNSNLLSWAEEAQPPSELKQIDATFDLSLNPHGPWLEQAHWEMHLLGVSTPWLNAPGMHVQLGLSPHPEPPEAASTERWAWWQALAPYQIALQAHVDSLDGSLLETDRMEAQLLWSAPELKVSSLKGTLYEGSLDLHGAVDIPSRQARIEGKADFDARRIRHLLSKNGRDWIDQYDWKSPPRIQAQASATLPEWDDQAPDWRGEVKPTMAIHAAFEVDEAAFRGVPVSGASSEIHFESMIWQLPNLVVHRPEGLTQLNYRCDAKTQDYVWQVKSIAQPSVLAPMLHPTARKVLNELEFEDPISIDGSIWGRWRDRDRIGAQATVKTGRARYRGENWETLTTQGSYADGLLHLIEPKLVREEGEARADGILINTQDRSMTLTNAVGRLDAMAIARVIGPKTARILEPYRFHQPPTLTMDGRIPFGRPLETQLNFDIQGGPFSYWKFNVPSIEGRIQWDQQAFHILNLKSDFYQGQLEGAIHLQLEPEAATRIAFDAAIAGVDMQPFMKDIVDPNREAKGRLQGSLHITSAITDDWGSWQGHGEAELKNGRLWDTPLFGVFSRLMNAVSPGLGNSQAADGQGSFTIEDSVIKTKDLSIQERSARLAYAGNVDFDGKLDARVEAELLRDTPMVGKFFSLALWPVSKLFEYEVGGTLGQPIIQPLYLLPKYFMLPFQSLQRMEGWLDEGKFELPPWFPGMTDSAESTRSTEEAIPPSELGVDSPTSP